MTKYKHLLFKTNQPKPIIKQKNKFDVLWSNTLEKALDECTEILKEHIDRENPVSINTDDTYRFLLLYLNEYKAQKPSWFLSKSEFAGEGTFQKKYFETLFNTKFSDQIYKDLTQTAKENDSKDIILRKEIYRKAHEYVTQPVLQDHPTEEYIDPVYDKAVNFLKESCESYKKHLESSKKYSLQTKPVNKKLDAVQQLLKSLNSGKNSKQQIENFTTELNNHAELIKKSRSSFLYRMGMFVTLFVPTLTLGFFQGWCQGFASADGADNLYGENVLIKLFRHVFYSEGSEFVSDVKDLLSNEALKPNGPAPMK